MRLSVRPRPAPGGAAAWPLVWDARCARAFRAHRPAGPAGPCALYAAGGIAPARVVTAPQWDAETELGRYAPLAADEPRVLAFLGEDARAHAAVAAAAARVRGVVDVAFDSALWQWKGSTHVTVDAPYASGRRTGVLVRWVRVWSAPAE